MRKIEAVVYIVDRAHPQYAGKLSHADLLKHVMQGEGKMGHCRDYVMNTLVHLRQMEHSRQDAGSHRRRATPSRRLGSLFEWLRQTRP